MLQQTVRDYLALSSLDSYETSARGGSAAPKGVIFHILPDNAADVSVLDIGFGAGSLGLAIKSNPSTSHWIVDGIDGFSPNCNNRRLVEQQAYRNIWYGYAQEIPAEYLARYKIICLLDVIEHLTMDTAKWLLRTLLTVLGEEAFLFISTPLWFYPQGNIQTGDLEEHLIGVPATSMMALNPKMYSVDGSQLVGGFVYDKKSLPFVDFFQPTADKSFTYEKGLVIAKAINLRCDAGTVYVVR